MFLWRKEPEIEFETEFESLEERIESLEEFEARAQKGHDRLSNLFWDRILPFLAIAGMTATFATWQKVESFKPNQSSPPIKALSQP